VLLALVDYFRNVADTLTLVGKGFQGLWTVVSSVLGAIVNSAAMAFGWMPEIGPKLRKAADDFNAFRDRVNNALSGIKDRTVRVTAVGPAGSTKKAPVADVGIPIRGAYASGGTVKETGYQVFGESGPEIAWAPKGTQVWTAAQTATVMGGRALGGQAGIRMTMDLSGVSSTGPGAFLASWFMGEMRRGGISLTVNGSRVVPG
jgi:hypothetical protein